MAAGCTICSVQGSGRREPVGLGVEAARAAAKLEREAGPLDRIAAVPVEVPAAAAAGVPYGLRQPLLDLRVVGVLRPGVHLEFGRAARAHGAQRVERIV